MKKTFLLFALMAFVAFGCQPVETPDDTNAPEVDTEAPVETPDETDAPVIDTDGPIELPEETDDILEDLAD